MTLYSQLPNQLTVLRLVLAGVFFLTLNQYCYPCGPHGSRWLVAAIVLFVLAALTDMLDGYLARKWHAESAFGRIMDPFCDKVLVLGAFIYLSGPRFVIAQAVERGDLFTMISGVYPWMVAVMLARELLVTDIRGEMETAGVRFGANMFGKLKMILQSIAVPVILAIVWLDPMQPDRAWFGVIRDVVIYTVIVVTLFSGVPYITAATSAKPSTRGASQD